MNKESLIKIGGIVLGVCAAIGYAAYSAAKEEEEKRRQVIDLTEIEESKDA